jgi:hypothetical protein
MRDDDRWSGRLRRLPVQFLLALLNATAILVIVAAVLAMIAVARVEQVADNIATAVSDAVFSQVDVDPRQTIVDVRELSAEVRALGAELAEARTGGTSAEGAIDNLTVRLHNLQLSLDALLAFRADVAEDVLRAASEGLASGVAQFGRCGQGDKA